MTFEDMTDKALMMYTMSIILENVITEEKTGCDITKTPLHMELVKRSRRDPKTVELAQKAIDGITPELLNEFEG